MGHLTKIVIVYNSKEFNEAEIYCLSEHKYCRKMQYSNTDRLRENFLISVKEPVGLGSAFYR